MATATLKSVWIEPNGDLIGIATVIETFGSVEYTALVPAAVLVGLTNAQKKEALRLALKAERDSRLRTDVSGAINGTVTV